MARGGEGGCKGKAGCGLFPTAPCASDSGAGPCRGKTATSECVLTSPFCAWDSDVGRADVWPGSFLVAGRMQSQVPPTGWGGGGGRGVRGVWNRFLPPSGTWLACGADTALGSGSVNGKTEQSRAHIWPGRSSLRYTPSESPSQPSSRAELTAPLTQAPGKGGDCPAPQPRSLSRPPPASISLCQTHVGCSACI